MNRRLLFSIILFAICAHNSVCRAQLLGPRDINKLPSTPADKRIHLSERRDIDAAKRFFIRAINKYGAPEKITLDGYAATHTAVRGLKESEILPVNVCVRTSKYLNNLIEQDHRRVKQRVYVMLGFKRFENAAATIRGIELAHKIRKRPFDTSTVEQKGVRAQRLWKAVLAA